MFKRHFTLFAEKAENFYPNSLGRIAKKCVLRNFRN